MGAALSVTGTVVLTPEAKQPLEVKAASVAVEGPTPPPDPRPQNFTFIESLFAAFPVGLLGLRRGREQGFYGLGGLEGGRITFRKTW